MAFRFGRQPLQFNFEQEPMQGVTYQTPSTPIPTSRNALQSTLVRPTMGAPPSTSMRRFQYENDQEPVEDSEPDKFDFGQMFKNKPTFDATQRYIDALESRPSLETYKPNMAQNIFGAIAGAGAGLRGAPGKEIYGSVERIRYGPYQRALADWEGNMQGLGSGAEAEIKKNEVDTRWMTSMGNLYNQKSLSERRGAQTDQGWAKIEDARKAQQDKIQIAQDAGMRIVKGVDGNVIAVNPRDIDPETGNPREYDLGTDTGAELARRRVDIGERQGDERLRQGAQGVAQGWGRLAQGAERIAQGNRRLDQGDRGLDLRGQDVTSRIQDRAFRQAATETTTQLTPADEKTIKETALQDTFINNPRFRTLVDPETGGFYEDAEDDPLYAQFQQYYTSRIAERMKPKTSTTGRRPSATNVAPTTGSVVTPPARTTTPGTRTNPLDFSQLPR